MSSNYKIVALILFLDLGSYFPVCIVTDVLIGHNIYILCYELLVCMISILYLELEHIIHSFCI